MNFISNSGLPQNRDLLAEEDWLNNWCWSADPIICHLSRHRIHFLSLTALGYCSRFTMLSQWLHFWWRMDDKQWVQLSRKSSRWAAGLRSAQQSTACGTQLGHSLGLRGAAHPDHRGGGGQTCAPVILGSCRPRSHPPLGTCEEKSVNGPYCWA